VTQKYPQISQMNRLTNTDSRQGRGVRRTHSPSVRAAETCAPVAGAAATRAQAGATCVPQDAGVPRGAAATHAQDGATGVPQDVVFLELVLLKLVLFPLVHGGQRHLLVKGKSSEKCSVDIDCLPAYAVQSVSFSVTSDVWHTMLFWRRYD